MPTTKGNQSVEFTQESPIYLLSKGFIVPIIIHHYFSNVEKHVVLLLLLLHLFIYSFIYLLSINTTHLPSLEQEVLWGGIYLNK